MAITYGNIFSEEQYISVAESAALYFRERSKAVYIPLIETVLRDSRQYRHRVFGDAKASFGTSDWVSKGTKARSKPGHLDFELSAVEMILEIPNDNINQYNHDNLLSEARQAEIERWIEDIDNAIFHGILDEAGQVHLGEGLLGRGANTIENISSGADEDLSTKGEIYKGVKNMIEEIPFRIRESLPEGVDVFVSSNLDSEVREPDRIYQDKIEFDFIYENMIGKKASPALKIRNWIVTDKVLAEATDDTGGVNADTVDTQGTHDRILVVAPDKRLVARVVSLWDLISERRKDFHVKQIWGWRGNPCVFDEEGIKYSEALTV